MEKSHERIRAKGCRDDPGDAAASQRTSPAKGARSQEEGRSRRKARQLRHGISRGSARGRERCAASHGETSGAPDAGFEAGLTVQRDHDQGARKRTEEGLKPWQRKTQRMKWRPGNSGARNTKSS